MTSVDERTEVGRASERPTTSGHRQPRPYPDREGWRSRLGLAVWGLALTVVSTVTAAGFLGMFGRPLAVPLVYDGDALSGGAQIKGTLENGWYEFNPSLGAPYGQNLHDFPMADNMQFVLAQVFGLFTDQWSVVYNLAYLSTYPLTALAAAWFVRVIGGSRIAAFGFGILYAFTPYHFIHSQPHLALSMLFVVPLFAGLIMQTMADQPIWGRRGSGSAWNPLSWATPKTVGTLLILGLTGSTSSYYSVFGLILMTFAVVVLAFGRHFRRVLGAVIAMGGLMVVMVVNMAPDILYARSMPVSPAAFARQPLESEIYALKFSALIFPAPWHRIGAFSRFRLQYDGAFPLPSESPTLGLVAALGFVFLLALPLVLMLSRRPVPLTGPWGTTQRHLALLAVVAFLFGTIGGLGTLFAFVISPNIRAWNRIEVYIALFGLGAMALLFDQGLRALRSRVARKRSEPHTRTWRVVALGACLVVVVVGVLDQAAPASWTSPPDKDAVAQWRNDATYVAAIENRVPSGTQIFQLPAMPFPESLPINKITDYEPIRPYLHSDDLKWSYAGLKGRPRADWQQVLVTQPDLRQVVALGASGFGGIHVDRFGYSDAALADLESDLRLLLGPPVVSPDKRFAFYDMTAFNAQLRQDYSASELQRIERHTIQAPIFYWQPGFGPPTPDGTGQVLLAGTTAAPRAVIDNPAGPIPMKLSFTIRANDADYPAKVDITWPDGDRQSVTLRSSKGIEVSHSFVARRGQSTLALAGANMASLNLIDQVLRDPALTFPLRGQVSRLAALKQTLREAAAAESSTKSGSQGDDPDKTTSSDTAVDQDGES